MTTSGVHPARPRRRHRGLVVLVVLLLLVVVGLVAADRLGRHYAEHAVSERLAGRPPFTTAPQVQALGSPFLTQVVTGRYDDIHVTGSGLTLGDIHGVQFDSTLRGVHVRALDAVRGKVSRIPVDDAVGTVLIPYAEFARLTKVPGLAITVSSGQVTVTAPVTVPFINKTFDVVADGRVSLAGRQLQLNVENVRVAGVSLPQLVVRTASDLLNSQIEIPALPYGLQLTQVTATDRGLLVAAAAKRVTITAG